MSNSNTLAGTPKPAPVHRSQGTELDLDRDEMRRYVLDYPGEGVLRVDAGGRCRFANAADLTLMGIDDPWLLLGRSVTELFHPHGQGCEDKSCAPCSAVFVADPYHCEECSVWRPDNACFPAEPWTTPIRRSGALCGCVLTVVDVSERRALETERQQLICELERKNEALQRFTYTVSHDLKSPLIAVRSYLGLLQQDLVNGNETEIDADIGHIDAAACKMQRLVENLLELARLGDATSAHERGSLCEVAHEVARLIAGHDKDLTQGIEISPALPDVHGDRDRLSAVLQNLLENAVKFSAGSGRCAIEIGVRGTGADRVCFVKDNGVGFEQDCKDRMFGLFERLDTDRPGSGVGLALVKRVVEHHGGRVWADSSGAGRGATFSFVWSYLE